MDTTPARRAWSRGYRAERRSLSPEAAVRAAVAGDEKTPLDVLRALASDTAAVVRTAVAVNPSTPEAIIWELTHDRESTVRLAAVGTYWRRSAPEADKQPEARRRMATDPNTGARALAVLAEDEDPATRYEVKRRIESPTAKGALSPEALSLLAAAHDHQIREAVARAALTRADDLRALSRDTEANVRRGVSLNKNRPDDVLRILANDDDPEVRIEVARVQDDPDVLGRLATDEVASVRAVVATNDSTSIETLLSLSRDPDLDVRRAVAGASLALPWYDSRLTTPVAVLEVLADDPAVSVRVEVALNEAATGKILATLADDPDKEVRGAVAFRAAAKGTRNGSYGDAQDIWSRTRRPKPLPADVLEQLAKARDRGVRRNVARQRNTPTSALIELVEDHDKETASAATYAVVLRQYRASEEVGDLTQIRNLRARAVLAGSDGTPAVALAAFAVDADPQVRRAVARNTRIPAAALRVLLHDADKETRARAHATASKVLRDAPFTPDELSTFVDCEDSSVRCAVASNPVTRASDLLALAKDPDAGVRLAVSGAIRHGRLDNEVLRAMGREGGTEVRVALALLQDLPEEMLRELAYDDEEAVRLAVADRYGFGGQDSGTQALIGIVEEADVPTRTLRAFARSRSHAVRTAVARHPRTPAPLLANLVRDARAEVRAAVAANENTASDSLTVLAFDQAPEVRESTAANPSADARLLNQLARDPSPAVRRAVGGNASTPQEALEALGADRDAAVALAVALHPRSTPVALRAILTVHSRPVDGPTATWQQRAALAWELNRRALLLGGLAFRRELEGMIPELMDELRWAQGPRQALAAREAAPEDVLAELAGHPDTALHVARNPSAPAPVLEVMAHAVDAKVRRAVAGNACASASALSNLALDEDSAVREHVASNPNTPRVTLEALCLDSSDAVRKAAGDALRQRTGTEGR